jgi:hypothetical protein
MTSPPSAPKRRRRVIIFTVVLVLVSMVSWWYWPRGDARFVGKWEAFDAFPGRSYWTLVLNANGTGFLEFPDGTTAGLMRWSVKGDQFWHGTPLPDRLVNAATTTAEWLGRPIVGFQEHGTIVEVAAEKIVIVRAGAWDGNEKAKLTLRRIPE